MAGERDDHEKRIADAVRELAGDDRNLDAPPPELWGRIAGALDDADHETTPASSPPPDLWDRIATEVEDLGGGPEVRGAPLHAPVPSIQRRRRPRGRVLAAVAAAVVLLVAAAVAVSLDRGSEGSPAEVVARASLSGAGLDPGGPDTGVARLVNEDGTWEVVIRAGDLPAPAAGTYYEAWLLGASSEQVQSLGTLEGSGGFAVPDGLDLAQFPLVDISIEPLDGNPAHSAQSVLRGRLEPT